MHRRIRRREGVVHQVLEDEAVVLDLTAGVYFGLDLVGTCIWEMLDGRPLHDVRDGIVEQFEVDTETAEKDLLRLVAELEAHSLVVADDPRSGDI